MLSYNCELQYLVFHTHSCEITTSKKGRTFNGVSLERNRKTGGDLNQDNSLRMHT